MNRHWLVLDVSYLCHRAFHSVGRHETADVSVLYGFFNTLVSLSREFKTDDMVFCFDSRHSLRRELFPKYKRNRRRRDESKSGRLRRLEFYGQLRELRRRLLPKIGFHNIFVQNGYEADDLIAEAVKNLKEKDRATIVSSDRDLFQLLDDHVRLWNPQKKKLVTVRSFKKKYGVHPCRWPEVKAIAGDPSDNVPGIVGVGEKTALKWVCVGLGVKTEKYQVISDGIGTINRNLRLVMLPFPGVGKIILGESRATADSWNMMMEELGMPSLVGMMPVRPSKARKARK